MGGAGWEVKEASVVSETMSKALLLGHLLSTEFN